MTTQQLTGKLLQAIAIRKAMSLDMPTAVFSAMNDHSTELALEASENNIELFLDGEITIEEFESVELLTKEFLKNEIAQNF